jgi:16S rRNA processing protein RimM
MTVNEIYIGEIVGTHGIKGEVRLISEFREKEYAFLKGKKVYIGDDRKEFTIRTYRHHKKYDMLTFEGIDDINEVIDMRFEKVYMDRKDIELKVPLEEEFVGLDVYFQKENKGTIVDLLLREMQDVLIIMNDNKKYMIPIDDHFIEKVDLKNHRMILKNVEAFFHED